MLKKLLLTSVSAVLRHPTDSEMQVCPPLTHRPAPRVKSGLRGWIISSLPPMLGTGRQRSPDGSLMANGSLASARQDFLDALIDIRSQQAGDLLRRIRNARSLRELWFLRTEVFNMVAHHRDQAEASHRMEALGAHFPSQVKHATHSKFGVTQS